MRIEATNSPGGLCASAVGYATCGEIGFEDRTEYTAIGTVVNLAARVCAIAPGGQILVTNRVHVAVDDRPFSRRLAASRLAARRTLDRVAEPAQRFYGFAVTLVVLAL